MEPAASFPLPADLPRPLDDESAAHLPGMTLPAVELRSTVGRMVDLTALSSPRTIIFCYPMTGVPGVPLPDGWNEIPGARGCTPQACSFRDAFDELRQLNAEVFGLSTQTTAYQQEMAERLHLPFEVLSDADFRLCDALKLPTFTVEGVRLVKRIAFIIRNRTIEHVFYPVFPPDESAGQVAEWLRDHPI